MSIISTDWCKNVLLYHLSEDINTRIRLKVTLMIQTQMTFQAGGNALWHHGWTCVHTQAVPLISSQLAIFSTSTKASPLQPAGPSLQVCVSVLRAYRHLARLTLTEARVWTRYRQMEPGPNPTNQKGEEPGGSNTDKDITSEVKTVSARSTHTPEFTTVS